MQSVAHALFDVGLQRVVSRNSRGLVTFRFRRVANVGHAQIHVAAFIVGEVGLTVRQVLKVEVRIDDGIPVGVILLERSTGMDWVRGRSDARLIERNRDHFMSAEIPDVADLDGQIVPRLPLNVKCVVDGVGKLVGAVVGCKGEQLLLFCDACRYPGSRNCGVW